ncbi:MAG TPA: LysR substrate-binding domain-containing protein [Planctomycetota bacterium]|nr:LysR substrate-binding domain-containing protein [Planctomycetota bacterium]
MSLDRLETLAEVAARGSITEAAKALGLTQPAASRRLQLLEEEIGAPLLARGRKGVRLTETGKLVVAEGEALLERYHRLLSDVRKLQGLEAGTVRVGGGATAVTALLPGAIRRFRAQYKDIVFEVREAGSREIAAAVAREELELGLVTLPVHADGLDLRPLLRDRIVLVAPRDHLFAGKRVAAAALKGSPLIGFEAGSAIRRIIDDALLRRGIAMQIVMELRSIQSILRMVELGLGLAFVSSLGLGTDAVRIDVPGLRIERTLAVATKRGRPLSAAAASFLKQLRG